LIPSERPMVLFDWLLGVGFVNIVLTYTGEFWPMA
jgi:hypothetical protein